MGIFKILKNKVSSPFYEFQQVHAPNFEGVSESEDFECATLPTTLFDFQGKVWNFCHPTLLKLRFKDKCHPPPRPPRKRQSQNYGALMNSNGLLTLSGLLSLKFLFHMTTFFIKENHFTTNFVIHAPL